MCPGRRPESLWVVREVGELLGKWSEAGAVELRLTALASGDAVSQVELSARTRRDPTRLGRHLEDLEGRGLVVRERSADQRQRTVNLTKTGRSRYSRLKKQIRAAEDELLAAHLSAAEAKQFRETLAKLLS